MKHIRTLLAGALTAALLLSGCTAQPETSAQPSGSTAPFPSETGSASAVFTPGTYEGTGTGYGGEIKVSVTVDETSITGIEVVEQTETESVGGAALLLHPAILFTFGAGAWAGSRGRDYLRKYLADREAWL